MRRPSTAKRDTTSTMKNVNGPSSLPISAAGFCMASTVSVRALGGVRDGREYRRGSGL